MLIICHKVPDKHMMVGFRDQEWMYTEDTKSHEEIWDKVLMETLQWKFPSEVA